MFSTAKVTHGTSLQIKSCHSEFTTQLEAVVLPKFEDCQPKSHFPLEDLKIPENISSTLADPKLNHPQQIDVILGVGLAFSILSVGQGQLSNGLVLQNTKLGWLAAGNLLKGTAMTSKPHVDNFYVTASLTLSQTNTARQLRSSKESNPVTYVQPSYVAKSIDYESLDCKTK